MCSFRALLVIRWAIKGLGDLFIPSPPFQAHVHETMLHAPSSLFFFLTSYSKLCCNLPGFEPYIFNQHLFIKLLIRGSGDAGHLALHFTIFRFPSSKRSGGGGRDRLEKRSDLIRACDPWRWSRGWRKTKEYKNTDHKDDAWLFLLHASREFRLLDNKCQVQFLTNLFDPPPVILPCATFKGLVAWH